MLNEIVTAYSQLEDQFWSATSTFWELDRNSDSELRIYTTIDVYLKKFTEASGIHIDFPPVPDEVELVDEGVAITYMIIIMLKELDELEEATVYVAMAGQAVGFLLACGIYRPFVTPKSYEMIKKNIFKENKKALAKLGGKARSQRYEPLRIKAMELVKAGKFQSRRQAAILIAPQILRLSKELSINLSEQQVTTTITGWLRKEGLPAKEKS